MEDSPGTQTYMWLPFDIVNWKNLYILTLTVQNSQSFEPHEFSLHWFDQHWLRIGLWGYKENGHNQSWRGVSNCKRGNK